MNVVNKYAQLTTVEAAQHGEDILSEVSLKEHHVVLGEISLIHWFFYA